MSNPLRTGLGTAHRYAAATALVLAPLLLITGGLLHPAEEEDAAAQLDVVRANLDRWYVSHLLVLAGFALLLPALLAWSYPLRTRAGGLHALGTGLAGLGIFTQFGAVVMDGFGLWLLAHAADRGTANDLAELSDSSGRLAGLLDRLSLGLAAGLIILAVAGWARGAVAAWQAALVAVAGVAIAVQLLAGLNRALAVAFLALAVAFVPAGLRLLTAGGRTGTAPRADTRPAATVAD